MLAVAIHTNIQCADIVIVARVCCENTVAIRVRIKSAGVIVITSVNASFIHTNIR
jgi:uncharacterized phosphosugar-binding protein